MALRMVHKDRLREHRRSRAATHAAAESPSISPSPSRRRSLDDWGVRYKVAHHAPPAAEPAQPSKVQCIGVPTFSHHGSLPAKAPTSHSIGIADASEAEPGALAAHSKEEASAAPQGMCARSALLEAGPTSDLAEIYGEADIELKRLHESILRQLFFC